MEYFLKCIECGREYGRNEIVYTCGCGGLLEVRYEFPEITKDDFRGYGVWRYSKLLPCEREPVTLKEGGTPLYECRRISSELGVGELYVKHEGANPTGSFKDRGMTVGVTKALELGAKAVACASTGNTSASLSLYASKAGMRCIVVLPGGKVALGKVSQALMHGAEVYEIDGNFDAALKMVRELCDERGYYLLNSLNPYRLEGQKTIAYEIAEEMGWKPPDAVVVPVGNAGNISAIYKGFKELKELGLIEDIPRMYGVQAEGASPIVDAIEHGRDRISPVRNPETIATAIRIGNPANAPKALRAIRESGGWAVSVKDDEIVRSQLMLARYEGIGVEPASAASIAGLRRLMEDRIDRDERVVCITTGHLLKDPEEVLNVCGAPMRISSVSEIP